MKKLAATLLSVVLCLGLFAGCNSKTVEREVERTAGAYSHVWDAAEDGVKHETGGLAVDAGWGAILNTNEGVLCSVETPKLGAPAYRAAARLLVSEQNLNSKNVAAVLRVVDGNGKELGKRLVRVCDFEATLTYQDFEFTFPVETATEASFEIYWPGTNYVRVSQFGVMSKKADSLPDFSKTGAALLGADIEEEAVEYSENNLYYFDLYTYMTEEADNAEDQYDIANLVSTLQGLVNRDSQRLFIRFMQGNGFSVNTDDAWLQRLREPGQFLADKTLVTVKSPMTLLTIFKNYYKGFAAWDPSVPATVNAAATACGVDDLLPVRYSSVRNSLYWYILNNEAFADKPVKVDLGGKFTGAGNVYQSETASTGSRKNDAYIWAKEQYLDTHKVNSHLMAYHVDAYASNTVFAAYSDLQNMYLSNRDYYIANKAFFFDLSPMEFEIPDDDPDQQDIDISEDSTIDYQTLTAVMTAQAAYAESVDATQPIDVGGFTPWHLKYTRYTNPEASGEVTCEWTTVRVFSMYNAYVNADAPSYTAMANASIYSQFPMDETYTQPASKEIKETLPAANEAGVNYLLFYMGDFDASSWLNTAMLRLWTDSNRGQIPLAWPFSLNISKRAGHVIDWMYDTATENDYFVAGDNGVGYLNPESYAKAASQDVYGDLDSWAAYNKKVYDRFDIDYTGFLITEHHADKEIIECYAKFCKGLATNFPYGGDRVTGIETVTSIDYDGNVNSFGGKFSAMKAGDKSVFTQVRFILRTPTDVVTIYNQLREAYPDRNFKVVDPYTFYGLLAQQNNR